MITIYKTSESTGLSVLAEPTNGCWINVVDPKPAEIARLENLGIPRDYITYPLDLDERARTERENGELLIVLRIPWFQGNVVDIPYSTIPLGIVLTKQYFLTICKYDCGIIQEFASGRVRSLSTAKRNRFILRILLSTANQFLTYLREITKTVDLLEDQLQASTRNREVLELLKYQKSLTYFTTALKSNELVLQRLYRTQLFRQYPEDEDLLEDAITETQQAIDMTNIASNILSSMMDAFASIISNNLNAVMKFLASITIIISLPTMIASFFGMNVDLPWGLDSHGLAFTLVLVISVAVSLIATRIFTKKDWL
ncbi:MAG: magnesium transporter CorA family protein [Anaerolineales bacterium]|nr:magnesium transporter CorA family protein [Anaerolineales bacterium]